MLLVPSVESFMMGAVPCEVTCIPTHKTVVLLPLVVVHCLSSSASVLPDGLAPVVCSPPAQDQVGKALPPWWLHILQGQDTSCNLCRAHVSKLPFHHTVGLVVCFQLLGQVIESIKAHVCLVSLR